MSGFKPHPNESEHIAEWKKHEAMKSDTEKQLEAQESSDFCNLLEATDNRIKRWKKCKHSQV